MQPYKIMIVDDEPHMRRLTEFSLRRGGYHRFIFAQDGMEALEIVKEEMPDIIIIDYIMPRLNGLGTLEQLKLSPLTRDIPVIMVSGWGELHLRHNPLTQGAAAVLTKPYSPTQLLEQTDLILSATQPALSA